MGMRPGMWRWTRGKSRSRSIQENQLWKYFSWTCQMPMCSWAVVPARMTTIDTTSSVTVSRNDAIGARIFFVSVLFTGFTELGGLKERVEVRTLVGQGLGRADELEEPGVGPLGDDRDDRVFGVGAHRPPRGQRGELVKSRSLAPDAGDAERHVR